LNLALSEIPTTSSTFEIGPKVTINGDGTGCIAIAHITSNSVSSISVIEEGTGYTQSHDYNGNSIVTITPTTVATNASAIAIISPPGGHGSNPVEELYGYNIMIHSEFIGSESNNFTISNDYRQFGLLSNSLAANGDIFTGDEAQQTINITVNSNTGIFFLQKCYWSNSGATEK
jgi:hypothetical protein